MASTPKVFAPDGVLREEFIFSTTLPSRFFFGTIDDDTVDMQISVRGGPFVTNPDLIVFEGTSFTVPNPSVFPDGFDLAPGLNVIEIRSISTSGAVSSAARIEARLIQESDVGFIPSPPTNITVERLNNAVNIQAEKEDDDRIQGFNFYASRTSGGGVDGYRRVNLQLVMDTFSLEETQSLAVFDQDSAIATNPDGTPAADPLFLQLEETQTKGGDIIQNLEDVTLTEEEAAAITFDEQENLLKTDYVRRFEIPETVTTVRTSVTVDSVVTKDFLQFTHSRTAGTASQPPTVPIGEFTATPISEPLFYVVTAVAFDEDTQTETESPFSAEVFGNPVTVSLNLGAFPVVSQSDIRTSTISGILRTNPQVALQPGAVIRDTVVDPSAAEAERVRFIVDFLHRAQSFDTLIQIDGVDANGDPIQVQNSAYKQALQRAFGDISTEQTQAIIDAAFEQLAAEHGITRRPGIRARGLVTFFTQIRPTATIPIPAGSRVAAGGTLFATTTATSIPLEDAASFFNPTTGLYSIDVPIQAQDSGEGGNVATGQIRTILDPVPGMQVVNPGATFGGQDIETNLQLAVRGKNALASVDSGTEAGYRQTIANVPGIEQAVLVTPGNDLMQRDFDTDFQKHVGGKVDIYTRGQALATVTDTFAFSFETANNVQFVLIGNPVTLTFQAQDPTLSTDNPIAEMLDFPDAGLGLRNASEGVDFSLTGVEIIDYRTIRLSTDVVQPTVDFGDVVLGDYRYVVSKKFVLPRQPVREVLSVTGAVSGELDSDNFRVFKTDDPLLNGGSVRAQTFVQIDQVNGTPTGEFVQVTGEEHVVIGEFDEPVNNLGANLLTVAVFNEDRTVEYRGPFDPSGVSDYTIIPGSQTTPLAIRRVVGGSILSGERLSIDYAHDENFVVEYTINLAVTTAQDEVDQMKHITADALVKETIPVPVDITATVVKETGFQTSSVDRAIRTNLDAFFSGLSLGQSVRQSDVIAEMERADGVSFIEVPVTKLARSAGACVIREPLVTDQNSDITFLPGNTPTPISTDTVLVWLIEDELNSATETGGGPETAFRTVTQDDSTLTLQVADPLSLGSAPNQAFIIGDDGLVIPGFSDDNTLEVEFPTASPEEVAQVRLERTQNRVMISLSVGDSPTNHSYTVTYTVSETNEGAKNLDAFDIEFFQTGNLNFTFDEDR